MTQALYRKVEATDLPTEAAATGRREREGFRIARLRTASSAWVFEAAMLEYSAHREEEKSGPEQVATFGSRHDATPASYRSSTTTAMTSPRDRPIHPAGVTSACRTTIGDLLGERSRGLESVNERTVAMPSHSRRGGAIAIGLILSLIALGCSEGDTSQPSSTTARTTTLAAATVGAEDTTTTAADEEIESKTDSSDPAVVTGEGIILDPGRHLVESLGTPFSIEVGSGWRVPRNGDGRIVFTDGASIGPGDNDVVFLRPTKLVDPAEPRKTDAESGEGWPVEDIEGWVGAVVEEVRVGDVEQIELGGLQGLQFAVSVSDDLGCITGSCIPFASNDLATASFGPETEYQVWWLEQDELDPIVIVVGTKRPATQFPEDVQMLLKSIEFGQRAANPVSSDETR